MFQGRLQAIFLGEHKGQPLHPVPEAHAVPGRGLAGDRYSLRKKSGDGSTEVTLIEAEALEGLERDYGHTLPPAQSRRNLLTRGVPLNHLVGQTFRVGEVVLQGVLLCEPCKHLEALTFKGVLAGLKHRGGLRARIVQGGVLRPGDAILPLPST